MVGGAPFLGHLERAHPEALREPLGERERPPALEPETAHGAPVRSASPSGIVCSGMEREGLGARPRAGARASSVVAPLTWPTKRSGGAAAAIVAHASGDRGVGHAEQRDLGAPAGLQGTVAAGELDRHARRARPPRRSTARPGPRRSRRVRQRPTLRVGRGGVGEIPFQFSHRRYQTASGRDRVGWPLAGPRPAGRGHDQGYAGGPCRRTATVAPEGTCDAAGGLACSSGGAATIGPCRSTSSGARHAEPASRSSSTPGPRASPAAPARSRADAAGLLASGPPVRAGQDAGRDAPAGAQERPAPRAHEASASARRRPASRPAGWRRRERVARASGASGWSRSTARPPMCTKCPLSETRTKVVFGGGNADADLMFVGEAPGAEEDRQGLPVRRPRRRAADRAARGDRADARGRLHRERVEVPAARQPRPAADRDRVLPAVHCIARSS